MNPLARRGERDRLAAGLFVLGVVHIAMFFGGNDGATPARLGVSFALATTLLVVAQRVRTMVFEKVRARGTSSGDPGSPR